MSSRIIYENTCVLFKDEKWKRSMGTVLLLLLHLLRLVLWDVFESRKISLIRTEKQNIFSLILQKQLAGSGTLPLPLGA